MLYTMDEIKAKSIPIAKKYGIARLGLFGSYARGEQNEHSDLDFLIVIPHSLCGENRPRSSNSV